jgi:hypothetical protein
LHISQCHTAYAKECYRPPPCLQHVGRCLPIGVCTSGSCISSNEEFVYRAAPLKLAGVLLLALPFKFMRWSHTHVSTTMLARRMHHANTLVPPAREMRSRISVHRIVPRQHRTTISFHGSNPATAKLIENRIREVNANKYTSAQQKYRTSVHLFAQLDHCKLVMEISALDAQDRALCRALRQPLVRQRFENGAPDPTITQVAAHYMRMRAARRRLAGLRWTVFRLCVFALWGDVPFLERLVRIPLFVVAVLCCTVLRMLLWYGHRVLRPWSAH